MEPVGHFAPEKEPLLNGRVIVDPEIADVETVAKPLLDEVGKLPASGHTPTPCEGIPQKGDHRASREGGHISLTKPETTLPMAHSHIKINLVKTGIEIRHTKPT